MDTDVFGLNRVGNIRLITECLYTGLRKERQTRDYTQKYMKYCTIYYMVYFYSKRRTFHAGKTVRTLSEVSASDYQAFLFCMTLAIAEPQLSAPHLLDINFGIHPMPASLTYFLQLTTSWTDREEVAA